MIKALLYLSLPWLCCGVYYARFRTSLFTLRFLIRFSPRLTDLGGSRCCLDVNFVPDSLCIACMVCTCSDWKVMTYMTEGDPRSKSITPPTTDSQPEPMQVDAHSPHPPSPSPLPGDRPAASDAGTQTLSSAPSSEVQKPSLLRGSMTPSPVLLGLLQQGGGAPGAARSPVTSSTQSSTCSIEESSPGLSPSLYFLREAHHFLGR